MIKLIEEIGGKIMRLDAKESLALYDKFPNDIEPNMCYNNMFNVAAEIYHNGWKIAYGYVQVEGIFFARHAFIVTDTHVIDPTIAHFNEGAIEFHENGGFYVVLATFDTMQEYLDAIRENAGSNGGSYYVDMRHALRDVFAKFHLHRLGKAVPAVFLD